MSKPSATALLIEARLGSTLADYVSQARREGLSWDAISDELRDKTQVTVTGESLRLWFKPMPRGERLASAS